MISGKKRAASLKPKQHQQRLRRVRKKTICLVVPPPCRTFTHGRRGQEESRWFAAVRAVELPNRKGVLTASQRVAVDRDLFCNSLRSNLFVSSQTLHTRLVWFHLRLLLCGTLTRSVIYASSRRVAILVIRCSYGCEQRGRTENGDQLFVVAMFETGEPLRIHRESSRRHRKLDVPLLLERGICPCWQRDRVTSPGIRAADVALCLLDKHW